MVPMEPEPALYEHGAFYTPLPTLTWQNFVPPYIKISEGAIEIGDRQEN